MHVLSVQMFIRATLQHGTVHYETVAIKETAGNKMVIIHAASIVYPYLSDLSVPRCSVARFIRYALIAVLNRMI